jgi:hypothetical protein
MKNFFRIALAVALVGAFSAQAAEAQVLDGFIQAQEHLDFLDGSGVNATGLTSSVQVGPYKGEFDPFNLRAVTSNRFALYCVDYLHYANYSDGLVNVYGIGGDIGNLQTTRQDDQTKYLQAAYLSSLFETYEGAANQTFMWSALHAAIWNVTSGVDVASDALVLTQRNVFLGLGVGGFTGAGWYVVSSHELADANYANGNYDDTGQEFLVQRSVPEPSTGLLMASGLLLLLGVGRRRLGETIG